MNQRNVSFIQNPILIKISDPKQYTPTITKMICVINARAKVFCGISFFNLKKISMLKNMKKIVGVAC